MFLHKYKIMSDKLHKSHSWRQPDWQGFILFTNSLASWPIKLVEVYSLSPSPQRGSCTAVNGPPGTGSDTALPERFTSGRCSSAGGYFPVLLQHLLGSFCGHPLPCTSLMGWTWKKPHCATKAVHSVGTDGSLIVFPQSHSQGCTFKIFTRSKHMWLLQRDTRRSRTGHVASGEASCWCLCLDYLYISFFYQPHRGILCAASTCPSQPRLSFCFPIYFSSCLFPLPTCPMTCYGHLQVPAL